MFCEGKDWQWRFSLSYERFAHASHGPRPYLALILKGCFVRRAVFLFCWATALLTSGLIWLELVDKRCRERVAFNPWAWRPPPEVGKRSRGVARATRPVRIKALSGCEGLSGVEEHCFLYAAYKGPFFACSKCPTAEGPF